MLGQFQSLETCANDKLSSYSINLISRIIKNYNITLEKYGSKYYFFIRFIWIFISMNFSDIKRYLAKNICFGSISDKFLQLFSPNFFFRNDLKAKNTVFTITKQKKYAFQLITLTLIIHMILKTLNKSKSGNIDLTIKQMAFTNTITKFYGNSQTVSQHNDISIIWWVGFGCENESMDQGCSYSQMNINISDCFFSRSLIHSSDGGVIYVLDDSYKMSIYYSMFYNCVCSSWGGAIYFYSLNSDLRMICANRCSASSYNHFSYIYASDMNQVEYLSVSYCSQTTFGYNSYCLQGGEERIDNSNSSMNNAKGSSGIRISTPSSFTSLYCTYSNNRVSDYICIYFYSDSVTMSNANVIHNNSPSYGVVYFYGVGSRMMYCIFQHNQNHLFFLESGSIEVSHSFIDHSESSFSSNIAVSTTNNSFTNLMTYQMHFFNSHYCNTDIPLIDTNPMMRTINQTIRDTIMETIPRTYVECIFTNQMANWREISMIFSFSFLCPMIIIIIL